MSSYAWNANRAMTLEVVFLALTASGFTALASVTQRRAAATAPDEMTFSWRLVEYLLHRPVWFVGILSMILGFVFQVWALRMGGLNLVQPLIATELVIVFAILALEDRRSVLRRDWLSALGIVVGLGAFLALARPSIGHQHSSASMWALAALCTLALAGTLAGLAYLPDRIGLRPNSGRKAALLGMSAAAAFGFVAAVVKELSTHLSQGPAGVFCNWSPYVLLVSGAVAFFLVSNAFQAGPLAASQPGLTIVDPLVASVLGIVLFGEQVDLRPLALGGEVAALTLVLASVIILSRSPLVRSEDPPVSMSTTPQQTNDGVGNQVARFPAWGLPVAEGPGEAQSYQPRASHAIQLVGGDMRSPLAVHSMSPDDPTRIKTGEEAALVQVKVPVR
jgi:drug/metabolite transporter (DMT)-like permease